MVVILHGVRQCHRGRGGVLAVTLPPDPRANCDGRSVWQVYRERYGMRQFDCRIPYMMRNYDLFRIQPPYLRYTLRGKQAKSCATSRRLVMECSSTTAARPTRELRRVQCSAAPRQAQSWYHVRQSH